jgi:signal transduction histidine kinase
MDDDGSRSASCYFPGEGEMVRAVHAKDWSATALGPVPGWPATIRTAVSISLNSNFQIAVLSGPELVYIYNDAAIPILGDKHPWALGRRAADVWPEAWPIIGPMLTSVLATGKATRHDDLLLELNRAGFVEECYFTFSYSPIRADAYNTDGVFVTFMETTRRVLAERRQGTVNELATQVAQQRGDEQTLDRVRQALQANSHDLPLAALYLAAPDGSCAEQVFCSGLRPGCAGIDRRIAWSGAAGGAGEHPLARLARGAGAQLYDASQLLSEAACSGVWPEAPRQLLALPLMVPGLALPRGFLLVGLNPRAPLDADYRQFIDTVGGLAATAVAGIDALAADRRRAEAVTERDRSKSLGEPAGKIRVVVDDNADIVHYIGRLLEGGCVLESAHVAAGGPAAVRAFNPDLVLASVIEGTSEAFASLDADLRLLTLNQAAASDLGAPRHELVGRKLTEVAGTLIGSDVLAAMRSVLADGLPQTLELFHPASRRWFSVRCFPAPQGLIVFANDITERKQAEQMLLEAKSELERRVEARTEELRQANQLLNVLYQRLQTVREEERTALAREVHDQLGQTLSAAKIDLKLLEDDLRQQGAALAGANIIAELQSACATLDRAMRLVREIATELREPELDGQGLYAALEWHARDFERRTRIAIHLELAAGLAQPARPAAEALLRIFQEAMTNVLRHAHAANVWVSVERRAGSLLLRVRDDGAGIGRRRARTVRSLGITGMRERAALARGRLTVGPLRPRGTLVSALIPLNATAPAEGGRA